jgi:hypothetical protein
MHDITVWMENVSEMHVVLKCTIVDRLRGNWELGIGDWELESEKIKICPYIVWVRILPFRQSLRVRNLKHQISNFK